MTRHKLLPTVLGSDSTFGPIFKHSVGLDDFFDRMFRDFLPAAEEVTYPPYNIRKDGNTRVIELALAGYDESDLDITLEDGNMLTIRGGKVTKMEDHKDDDYIHRGVAARRFERKFQLTDNAEVTKATYKDGMLRVTVEVQPVEEPEPKRITITTD